MARVEGVNVPDYLALEFNKAVRENDLAKAKRFLLCAAILMEAAFERSQRKIQNASFGNEDEVGPRVVQAERAETIEEVQTAWSEVIGLLELLYPKKV